MMVVSQAQNVPTAPTQVASLGPSTATSRLTQQTIQASQQAASGSSGFTFGDFLDIINPLQHLPVIGTIYRAITGDKIGEPEQLMGDALYGGVIGLGASFANLIFKDVTGKDFGDTVLAWLDGSDDSNAQPTAIAAAKPAASQPSGAQSTGTSSPGAKSPDMLAAATAVPGAKVPGTQPPAAKPSAPTATQPVELAEASATPAALFGNASAANAPKGEPTAIPNVGARATQDLGAKVEPAQATSMLTDPAAFMAALKSKGIDPTLAMRAMSAYQKSIGLSDGPDNKKKHPAALLQP